MTAAIESVIVALQSLVPSDDDSENVGRLYEIFAGFRSQSGDLLPEALYKWVSGGDSLDYHASCARQRRFRYSLAGHSPCAPKNRLTSDAFDERLGIFLGAAARPFSGDHLNECWYN